MRPQTPLEARLAAFPSFVLLLFSAFTALLWTRPAVWRTASAIAGAAASCLALLLVIGVLPLTSQLSVWRPVSLFGEGLLLTLDDPLWPVAFVICGLPIVCILSRVGGKPLEGVEVSAALAMAGLGLAALQAGNLLTLMVTWSLMGVCRLAWIVAFEGLEYRPAALARVGLQEAAAPLLLMLASFLDQSAAPLSAPMRSSAGAVAFLLAVLTKALPVGGDSREPARPLIEYVCFRLLPASVALASWGRLLLSGVPPPADAWGGLLGMLVFLSGALGWLGPAGRRDRSAWLIWSLVGMGTFLGCQVAGEAALAMAALLLLVGGLSAAQRIQQPWQRLWPAASLLAAAGLPGLPGAGVIMLLGERGQGSTWAIALPAMAMTAAGLRQRGIELPIATAQPAAARVRGTDLACLALLLSGAVASIQQGWLGNSASFLLSAGILLLAIAGLWLVPRQPWLTSERLAGLSPLALARRGERAVVVLLDAGQQTVAAVASLFEGRAGMLWMFLVVLAAWLALRG